MVTPQWVDFRRLPPMGSLRDRIRLALDLYPCDVLFVHRDAERESPEVRREEIRVAAVGTDGSIVPVVPVRMTEAWLLFNESAIRGAAGNPNGRVDLQLPALARVELLPDPKATLHEALRRASELNARRRNRLKPGEAVHRVADLIDDFGVLEAVPSFRLLQEDIRQALGA